MHVGVSDMHGHIGQDSDMHGHSRDMHRQDSNMYGHDNDMD